MESSPNEFDDKNLHGLTTEAVGRLLSEKLDNSTHAVIEQENLFFVR
jgi:hypothetical protein